MAACATTAPSQVFSVLRPSVLRQAPSLPEIRDHLIGDVGGGLFVDEALGEVADVAEIALAALRSTRPRRLGSTPRPDTSRPGRDGRRTRAGRDSGAGPSCVRARRRRTLRAGWRSGSAPGARSPNRPPTRSDRADVTVARQSIRTVPTTPDADTAGASRVARRATLPPCCPTGAVRHRTGP